MRHLQNADSSNNLMNYVFCVTGPPLHSCLVHKRIGREAVLGLLGLLVSVHCEPICKYDINLLKDSFSSFI